PPVVLPPRPALRVRRRVRRGAGAHPAHAAAAARGAGTRRGARAGAGGRRFPRQRPIHAGAGGPERTPRPAAPGQCLVVSTVPPARRRGRPVLHALRRAARRERPPLPPVRRLPGRDRPVLHLLRPDADEPPDVGLSGVTVVPWTSSLPSSSS